MFMNKNEFVHCVLLVLLLIANIAILNFSCAKAAELTSNLAIIFVAMIPCMGILIFVNALFIEIVQKRFPSK